MLIGSWDEDSMNYRKFASWVEKYISKIIWQDPPRILVRLSMRSFNASMDYLRIYKFHPPR